MRETSELTHETQSELAPAPEPAPRVAPAVDIYENKDEIVVVADLPGVSAESLNVRLDPPELLIEGTQRGTSDEGFRAVEFSRRFRVPDGLDAERVTAELKHGVLRVTLRKAERVKPRKIEVRAA